MKLSLKEQSLWKLTSKLELHETIEYCKNLEDIAYSVPNFWKKKLLDADAIDQYTIDRYEFFTDSDWFKYVQIYDREIDSWDEGDDDPSRFLDLISELNLTGYLANYIFAYYMNNYNTLDDQTVQEFIALGVDINAINNNYWTDSKNDNALSYAAEYRRIEDMKVLLKNGADPNIELLETDILTSFMMGHNPYYTDIDSEQDFDVLFQGIELLVDYGVIVTQDIIDLVEENYSGEWKPQVIETLVDMIE